MGETILETKSRRPFVGGQAVIEGVMFRSPRAYAVAVRDPAGEIVVDAHDKPALTTRLPWRLPFLRGVVTLYESLDVGIKALMFSAEVAEPPKDGKEKKKASFWETSGVVIVSFAFGLALFVGVPYALAYLLKKPLGMAYLPVSLAKDGSTFEVDIRGKRVPAVVVPKPFYKRSK